jgi:pyruvate, water dikinase
MGSIWQRLRRRISRRRPPPVAERFSHFLAIGSANDRFLGRLAEMMEVASGPRPLGKDTVESGFRTLSAAVHSMVSSLSAMAPGRHLELPARLAELEAELGCALPGHELEQLPLTVFPGDPLMLRSELVGGKAAHLAALAEAPGVAVPPFFAVTLRGYRSFLDAVGARKRIGERLLTNTWHDNAALKRLCEEIRRAVLLADVPVELATAMVDGYRRLRERAGRMHLGVAVRSSAVAEDSEVSFAGQFESVLGVHEGRLASAYKHVVASRFRQEAVRYARLSGFLDEEVAMPVLVTAMLQPAVSGVAYSRDPDDAEAVLITAVRGLAVAALDGRVTPDRYRLRRQAPHELLLAEPAHKEMELRCSEQGGVLEVPLLGEAQDLPALAEPDARRVAELALRLEEHFGRPQDVEWVIDEGGALQVVQSRPLETREAPAPPTPSPEGRRLLLSGGVRAYGGIISGPVVQVIDLEQLDAVPAGSVLVVPTTSPRLSAAVERVAAIVTEAGSPTGHMATVAREFRVPTVVGAEGALAALRPGSIVTVDAWAARVYEGEVIELLGLPRSSSERHSRDVAKESLRRLLERVAPLTLDDPASPEFRADRCRTLHDVARFVHQKAMAEMFGVEGLSARERRQARRLHWQVPMELLVLDLGGGVADGTGHAVELGQISSVPMAALLEGMTDPRLRWAGPVGFDLRGFMSVVVRSAADDQRYGEPSFALCSRDYVHFSSRLAYHFASCDAMCSSAENQNHARFVFHGGAAVAERREWRAHFLSRVLRNNGFFVRQLGDRVEASLGKLAADVIEEALVLVGRLMVSARHLDMVIDSPATAEAYAHAFLAGDFGFEFIRKELK